MRIWLFLTLALLGAIPFGSTATPADEAAVTPQLQQLIDGYVRDRASIEGLSGAALQVDRGASHPIVAVFAGDDGLSDKKPIGPERCFRSAATPRRSPPRSSSNWRRPASSASTTRSAAGCRNTGMAGT